MSQVAEFEQQMEINSSHARFENISSNILDTAGKMFVYLKSCHINESVLWIKTWSTIYTNIFNVKSADHILLTLNRMMKMNPKQSKEVLMGSVFKTTAEILARHDNRTNAVEIQRMLLRKAKKESSHSHVRNQYGMKLSEGMYICR